MMHQCGFGLWCSAPTPRSQANRTGHWSRLVPARTGRMWKVPRSTFQTPQRSGLFLPVAWRGCRPGASQTVAKFIFHFRQFHCLISQNLSFSPDSLYYYVIYYIIVYRIRYDYWSYYQLLWTPRQVRNITDLQPRRCWSWRREEYVLLFDGELATVSLGISNFLATKR